MRIVLLFLSSINYTLTANAELLVDANNQKKMQDQNIKVSSALKIFMTICILSKNYNNILGIYKILTILNQSQRYFLENFKNLNMFRIFKLYLLMSTCLHVLKCI